jgi:hypothetical protein
MPSLRKIYLSFRYYSLCRALSISYWSFKTIEFIGNSLISKLNQVLVDQERVTTILVNIIYYIVSPNLKTRP